MIDHEYLLFIAAVAFGSFTGQIIVDIIKYFYKVFKNRMNNVP